ncbi:rhomboid-like protein [Streptomyces sp. NPDC017993]|uniref:rhomboid-like protein n=1 Tax=Streptomyces sp. NPDC017993 TaxID=3365027 RepID=UPI00378856F3
MPPHPAPRSGAAPAARRVPWITPLYVGAVQLRASATARLPRRQRVELLRAHSTNVANLRAGRWRTLATSAVFVEEPLPAPYAAALLAALGTAEVRWGPARAAGLFAAGHLGASLLVYAGLRGRVRADPPDATARAVDVGASYGFCATVGALAATVPHRGARVAATAGLLALGIRPVLRPRRTFTDAGHLAAVVLGVAAGAVLGAGEPWRAPAGAGTAGPRGPVRAARVRRAVRSAPARR